jgi:hypothetical protein
VKMGLTRWLFGLTFMCLSACGQATPSADVVAKRVVAMLVHNPPVSDLRGVYERLASVSQQELQRRADGINAGLQGMDIKPWEVIGYRSLVRGDRVTDVELLEVDDSRARVRLKTAYYLGAPDGKKPLPVELTLLREEGQWRVVLPFDVGI